MNWIVLVNSLNTGFQYLLRKSSYLYFRHVCPLKFNYTYKACWGRVILISLFKFRTNNISLKVTIDKQISLFSINADKLKNNSNNRRNGNEVSRKSVYQPVK